MIEDGIAELLAYARQAKMPLALEPLHPMYAADRAAVNTLAQALDIADRLDAGGTALGVAVDVYHTRWDPDLYAGIARAGRAGELFASPRLRLAGADQGHAERTAHDGRRRVVDLRRVRQAVEDAGSTGLIEAEIFSDCWWSQPWIVSSRPASSGIARSSDIPSSRAKPPEGWRSRGPLCRCIVKIGPSATPRLPRRRGLGSGRDDGGLLPLLSSQLLDRLVERRQEARTIARCHRLGAAGDLARGAQVGQ